MEGKQRNPEPIRLAGSILAVLDLQEGLVVRGIAGRRSEYRPIVSGLASSAKPLEIANALRDHFGFESLYVADLDAITRDQLQTKVLEDLVRGGFQLTVDAGVRTPDRIRELEGLGVSRIVVGLECLPSPDALRNLLEAAAESTRIGFSLDLMHGAPMADSSWPKEPLQIAEIVCGLPAGFLIALDLAAVGTSGGPLALELCRAIRNRFPELTLISGGGIRSQRDIEATLAAGVDEVLVASALHDGRLDTFSLKKSPRFDANHS